MAEDTPAPATPADSSRRAWGWILASAVCGIAATHWQFEEARSSFDIGSRVQESLLVWRCWLTVPWLYLILQGRRIAGFPSGLALLGVAAMSTVLLSILVWQLRIANLPPARQVIGMALLPALQGGAMALVGLTLWVYGRWRTGRVSGAA